MNCDKCNRLMANLYPTFLDNSRIALLCKPCRRRLDEIDTRLTEIEDTHNFDNMSPIIKWEHESLVQERSKIESSRI